MATPLSQLQQRGTALAEPAQPQRIFDLLNNDKVKRGLAAVAGSILSPERVMKLVTNAIHREPKLGLCDPRSVLGGLMASVSLGLEPNTPQGHAYLIPYKRRAQIDGVWQDTYDCQFQVGYRGFIVLGYRSKHVRSIDGDAICAGDHFKHMKGSKSFLEHEIALVNRGSLMGAYCHSHLDDGIEVATVMPLDHILSVRDRSETYRALNQRVQDARSKVENNPRDGGAKKDLEKAERTYAETPWVLRLEEMAIKTAIKRHCNARLPLDPGDLLRAAVDIDNASDRGIIDLKVLAEADAVQSFAEGVIPSEALIDDEPNGDEESAGAEPERQRSSPDSGADRATSPPQRAPESSSSQQPRTQRGPIE